MRYCTVTVTARRFLAQLASSDPSATGRSLPERIQTVSFGKERPVALGSDEASWARNRRAVTVTVQ